MPYEHKVKAADQVREGDVVLIETYDQKVGLDGYNDRDRGAWGHVRATRYRLGRYSFFVQPLNAAEGEGEWTPYGDGDQEVLTRTSASKAKVASKSKNAAQDEGSGKALAGNGANGK